MNYIELFAGCGGLSLGLKSLGFESIIANDLSPMAAETYVYNLFNENLEEIAKKSGESAHALWLCSKFKKNELSKRLREDTRISSCQDEYYSDLDNDFESIKGKFIVGDIVKLNDWLLGNSNFLDGIWDDFGDINLVSGGPPCQGFSMAGLRKKDSERNKLPWEFVRFVQIINPKFVLLENVSGILRPFSSDGEKFHAWFEIAKAFSGIGYIPLCLHVNAKFVGVPQNRPRFILIGIRKNIFELLEKKLNYNERKIFSQSVLFFDLIQRGESPSLENLVCKEVNFNDENVYESTFLRHLIKVEKFISVKEAIDDLRKKPFKKGKYSKDLESIFSNVLSKKNLSNHEYRKNTELVRRRFRIYQVLGEVDKNVKKEVINIIKGISNNIDDIYWSKISKYKFLKSSGDISKFKSKDEFVTFLKKHRTKKQTQRALIANKEASATLSIPDDVCHYHPDELRTLTVREMARIQSFPDSFEFRSKVTTGGKMRNYEVPQYTQVGNAVPPLLGRALGEVIKELMEKTN